MKFKTTQKAIKQMHGKHVAIGYCGAQCLLGRENPIAYTSGVCGWNCDVYVIDDYVITTGYRGLVGVHPDYELLKEYEEKAENIRKSSATNTEETRRALLVEFLHKIA